MSSRIAAAAAAESLPRKAKPVADHTSCPTNAKTATYVSPPLHDASLRSLAPSPRAPQLQSAWAGAAGGGEAPHSRPRAD
jgi:hypothetical protein